MVVFVLAWLALSVIATLAYLFGTNVGFRRGLEQASAQLGGGASSSPSLAARDIAVEVRLPEDAPRRT